MNPELFRQYLQIAKEQGVTQFKIDGTGLEACLIQTIQPIQPEELLREMPSDDKLLGLSDEGPTNLEGA